MYSSRRRIRRKYRRHDDELLLHNQQEQDDSDSPSKALDLENMDNDTIQQLQGTIGNKAVQRLLDFSDTDSESSVLEPGSKIAALDLAYKAYRRDEPTLAAPDKLTRLRELLDLCDAYLNDSKYEKSNRRPGVEKLKTQLQQELDSIKSEVTGEDSSDEKETPSFEPEKVGGDIDEKDYVKLSSSVKEDTKGESVKAPAEIPSVDPLTARRASSTFELTKVLEPSQIPKPFLNKFLKKGREIEDSIAAKIEGFAADSPEAAQYKADPIYRQVMSIVLLLDFIAVQTDRKPGNYVMQMNKEGKVTGVKGIDYDPSLVQTLQDLASNGDAQADFLKKLFTGGPVHDLTEIDRKFAQKIVLLSDMPRFVDDALTGLVSDTEIEAILSRLESLAEFLRPLVSQNTPVIKSVWK